MNHGLSRRQLLGHARKLSLAGLTGTSLWSSAKAETMELPFGNGRRPLVKDIPTKGEMILQRTRPLLLETPFEVFDQGAITPNHLFYVRWHLANIPTSIDPVAYRLRVRGHVQTPLALSLEQLRQFETFEITAVNQCSGNARGLFSPRVPGGQWGNGAMGNARWTGVRLRDVLDRAGVKGGALQVRFNGMDTGLLPATPDYMKSLAVDHARGGEVMLAYAMNGEPLPILNGFPLRLVVPGWYATYWVKMLDDIEVLAKADDNFWMTKAYMIPDSPDASVQPGQQGVKTVPINRMNPRSFITNLHDGATIKAGSPTLVRGIAMGGDAGVAKVLLSTDAGQHWQEAKLGADLGPYSFRQWELPLTLRNRAKHVLMVKAVNTRGVQQTERPIWNSGGYMRNVIEAVTVNAV